MTKNNYVTWKQVGTIFGCILSALMIGFSYDVAYKNGINDGEDRYRENINKSLDTDQMRAIANIRSDYPTIYRAKFDINGIVMGAGDHYLIADSFFDGTTKKGNNLGYYIEKYQGIDGNISL